ncbi:MAG: YhdP family protein, partial [Planctomycetota bacterium]
MQTQKNLKDRPQKKNKKRILKFVSVFIVVLIVLVVILVPVLVSSEKGREIILAKINNSIDGKADFASLSMGWWKGIKVTDVSFNNSSGQTSVEVKQIATKPHYGSILFGSVSLGKTIIEKPSVEINLKARQPKKDEDPKQKYPAGKKAGPIALPIKKVDLVINDGNLKVTDAQAGTVEIAQINSKLNLRPLGERTDFDLAMIIAKQGSASKIITKGQIKPSTNKGWTFKGTSGDLTVKVDDLDLGSLEPLLAWVGVELDTEGKVTAEITSEVKDGRLENLSANIKAENLDITGPLLKGDRLMTKTLDVNAKLVRQQKMISIENLDVKADWLKVQATGMVPATFDSFSEFLQSDSNLSGSFELDVAQVFSQMPQTFGVKEDMKVTSGK